MKLQDTFILCCLIFGLLCPVSAKQLSSEKIVFASNRDGNWEIYMMNPDGTRQERLTYDRAVDCDPVISPAGDQILFNSNRGGTRDLYLMDVDGRNVRPLFGFTEAYRTHPAWSPNGERIIYSQRALGGINIHTAGADGTSAKLIVYLENAHSGYPTWSSDGTEIAYVVADEIHWASRQIRFINLYTRKQEPLSLTTSRVCLSLHGHPLATESPLFGLDRQKNGSPYSSLTVTEPTSGGLSPSWRMTPLGHPLGMNSFTQKVSSEAIHKLSKSI